MRTFALLSVFALMTSPALAQDSTSTLNRTQTSPGDTQTIQTQVQNNLQQAGFTDIQIMPSSFLVRAKDKAGNPVMMVISPDSVTAVTEITAPADIAPSAQGNAAGGAVNVPAGNSGAGIAGQPGNKSGPSANSSATTGAGNAPAPSSTQDASKVPGLPGGKSGPSVRPPSASAPK